MTQHIINLNITKDYDNTTNITNNIDDYKLCVMNSKILRSSFELISDIDNDDYDTMIIDEFKKMCLRFDLNETQMITLVTTINLSLLNAHYNTIWNSFNYYSMDCMDEYKNKYVEKLYTINLSDHRIEYLCDDLKEYIKANTCINVVNDMCRTFKNACEKKHDLCVIYLLNDTMYNGTCHCSYFHRSGCRIFNDCGWIVCQWGASLNVVKYLFEVLQFRNSNKYIDWASKHGHIDVVKYLFEVQHANCTTDAIDWASAKGHLSIVKYLFEVQHKDCTTYAIDWASQGGHLSIVKYLFEVQHKDCSTYAIYNACEYNHLDVVKYLFEVQHKDCSHIQNCVISKGYINILQYLFEVQHKDCNENAITYACNQGHHDVVKYLVEIQNKNIPIISLIYAKNNDMRMYLIKNKKWNTIVLISIIVMVLGIVITICCIILF